MTLSCTHVDFSRRPTSRTVNVPHQDPADRFIAATAQVFELTLVTDDDNLLKGRGFDKLANR